MTGRLLTNLRMKQASIHRFNEALSAFSASYAVLDYAISFNICPDCLSEHHLELEAESTALLSHGLCSCCGKIKMVADLELLKLYRAAGLSTDQIRDHLPTLRQDFPTRPMLTEQVILDRMASTLFANPPQALPGGSDPC